MQKNFSSDAMIQMKQKFNAYLECYILEAYTIIQNKPIENFGMTIFLQGRFTELQCL